MDHRTPLLFSNRQDVWFSCACFALCAVGAFATPYLTDLPFGGVFTEWNDRPWICLSICAVLCVLGILRLRRALGLQKRSWRRTGLTLLLVPSFVLPGLLGSEFGFRPLDPKLELRSRDLPGYRLSLPDWSVRAERLDFSAGSLVLRRRPTPEEVRVDWQSGNDLIDAQKLDRKVFGTLDSVVTLGDEPAIVAGTTTRTHYYRRGGWVAARTAWACPADPRIGVLTTVLSTGDEVLRELHRRIMATVSCAPK